MRYFMIALQAGLALVVAVANVVVFAFNLDSSPEPYTVILVSSGVVWLLLVWKVVHLYIGYRPYFGEMVFVLAWGLLSTKAMLTGDLPWYATSGNLVAGLLLLLLCWWDLLLLVDEDAEERSITFN